MTATPAPAPALATHSTQPGLPASHPIRDGRTTGSALIAA